MKAYHYLIIIAVILGIWYFWGTKKEKSSNKKEDKKNNEPTPEENEVVSPVELATLTYDEAVAEIEKAEEAHLIRNILKVKTAIPYQLSIDEVIYKIDGDTFNQLQEDGLEVTTIGKPRKK